MPADANERKSIPIVRGFLDYFPNAASAVAALSLRATKQHHRDAEMHWDRSKSTDHADTLVRHLMDRGTLDTDGVRHSVKAAWRALAMLEQELEEAGATPGRSSRFPGKAASTDPGPARVGRYDRCCKGGGPLVEPCLYCPHPHEMK